MSALLHPPFPLLAGVVAGLAAGALLSRLLYYRRRLDRELQRSQQRYRELSEMMPQVVFETDHRGVITHANSHAFSILGYGPEDLRRGIRVVDLVAPEERERAARTFHRRLSEGDTTPTEYTMLTRDGRRFPALVYAQPVIRGGRALGLHGVVLDIHDRRRSEELFRGIFESAPYAIVIADPAGAAVRMANPAFQRLSGYGEEELLGRTPGELGLIPVEETRRHLERLAREGSIQDARTLLTCRHGEQRHVIFSASVNHEAYEPYILAVLVDISEEVRSREQLLKLAAAVENADEDVILTDVHGKIQYVNSAFERILGYTREEVLDQNPRLLKSGHHDARFYARLWSTILRGGTWRGRLFNRRKSGELVIEDASITGVYDAEGRRVGFVSVKRDVTEQVRMEQRVSQAQKMEAIGTLAGGIAHDFNNILSAILGYAELAQEDLPPESPARSSLSKVLRAGERARDLVSQILAFSRQGGQERKPLRLEPVIKEVLKLLRATLPSTIRIESELACEHPVQADPTRIHQIVLNLCTNAAHAMREEGGTLRVDLDEVDVEEGSRSGQELQPGRYARLRVRDTGQGIEAEIQQRVFEPFFTTKRQGEGTGLGLSVVHGIVRQHGGSIGLESEPGRGTLFEVLLPLLETLDGREEVEEEGPLPLGIERVLFVDDEEAQRDVAKEGLSRFGYRVVTAADAGQALAIFAEDPGAFDIVVSDMTMPGMTGDLLAERLLQRRPDLPILLCTGFSERLDPARVRRLGVAGVALKPLPPRDLASRIREVLDA